MENKATLIKGGRFEDERGILTFVNEFSLNMVKRMYVISQRDSLAVRAWQGHRLEQKWFFVIHGGFELVLVKPDDWENPSAELPVERFILHMDDNSVLHVPGGYANGIRALYPESRMMVFSDIELELAGSDNFRFDKKLWYNWDSVAASNNLKK